MPIRKSPGAILFYIGYCRANQTHRYTNCKSKFRLASTALCGGTYEQKEQQLFDILDREAFQPVLKASEGDFPENRRDKLEHVKRATEDERERFQGYGSAEKMYQRYRDDLTSENAKRVDRDLLDPGLPILADCRQKVAKAARELGVAKKPGESI